MNINILVTMGGDDSSPEVRTLEHSFSHDSQTIHIAWTRTGGGHYESITETPPSEQFLCLVKLIIWIKLNGKSTQLTLTFLT